MFKKKKIKVYFDEEEKSIMLKSLIDLHNEQIKRGRYTDPVDDLIIRISSLKKKQFFFG
jgi:hypothetical protein